MFSAMAFPLNSKSALDVSEKERELEYERRWKLGGIPFIGSFRDLNINKKANETAANFVSKKIKNIVKDEITAKNLTPNYVWLRKLKHKKYSKSKTSSPLQQELY